ncbi:Ppx/GppA phosphatase family protein [Pelagibius sp.]|uniref:Ppx/GppA phosphatase family protein n=1 Tax=Pelagibius sp. TaxID=1931238 RepID=UPI002AC34059|nr:Ppx/GppA phosphatase family protein [Pelagibius sp.]
MDLGTNNCRLLVARPQQDGFRVVDAFSRIVRLGEGLSASGRLSDEAMARTLDALKVCASKIRRRGATQVRAVATEACRRARNCEAFLARVRSETGIELEIISQDEEAKLAIYGCAPLIDPQVPDILLFDIGGGSTEVCWLKAAQPIGRGSSRRGSDGAGPNGAGPNGSGPNGSGPNELEPHRLTGEDLSLYAWSSIPIGVISMAERFGGGDLTPSDYDAMVGVMREAMSGFTELHDLGASIAGGEVQMLGTSGTVTTLVGVHFDLPRYDRSFVDGSYLDMETVHRICRRIAAMSYGERAGHACIGAERADLVVAGCAILTALCSFWPAERLRVADRGLREGMLYTMMHGRDRRSGRSFPLSRA